MEVKNPCNINLDVYCKFGHLFSGLKPPETYRDIIILNYAFRTIVNQSNPLHDDLVERKNRDQENDDEGGSSFIARACKLLVKYNMVEDEIVPEGCSSFPPWNSPQTVVCSAMNDIQKKVHSPAYMKASFLARQLQGYIHRWF